MGTTYCIRNTPPSKFGNGAWLMAARPLFGTLPYGIKIRVSGHSGAGQGCTGADFERP